MAQGEEECNAALPHNHDHDDEPSSASFGVHELSGRVEKEVTVPTTLSPPVDLEKPPQSRSQITHKRLRLRYAGDCVLCGAHLGKGEEAWYHSATRTVRCIECPQRDAAEKSVIDARVAGGSAQREYERRKTAREARVKARLGNIVGGVALAIAGDPQSTYSIAMTGFTSAAEIAHSSRRTCPGRWRR